MSNDIFSNCQIDELHYECYEGISMDEKACSMFDMDIGNSSCFCEVKCKPTRRSKPNVRNNILCILCWYCIPIFPKSFSPKTRKRTVLHGFYDRKINSSRESYHIIRKDLLKYPSILLNSTRMIESIWGDLEHTRHCVRWIGRYWTGIVLLRNFLRVSWWHHDRTSYVRIVE